MAFIDNLLQVPSYGWADKDGKLVIPSVGRLYSEAFSRINIFKTKKIGSPLSTGSWQFACCHFCISFCFAIFLGRCYLLLFYTAWSS